jgi:origin recognition complex subunit 5
MELLKSRWPGRTQQLDQLLRIFGQPTDYTPPLILHGSTATGKSELLSDLLRTQQLPHAFVHCAECYSQQLLLELILTGLREQAGIAEGGLGTRVRDLGVFAQQVAQVVKSRDDDQTTYIVLDQAEHLLNQGLVSSSNPGLLPGLMSIESLIQPRHNICVIIVVEAAAMRFLQGPAAMFDPVYIHFPPYSKDQLVNLLILSSPDNEHPQLYKSFCKFLFQMFQSSCGHDLRELRHLSRCLYPKFIKPLQTEDVGPSDERKLFKLIQPHARALQQTLYQHDNTGGDKESDNRASMASKIEQLSHVSRFIAVAAYIASFNPIDADMRHFAAQVSVKKARRVSNKNKKQVISQRHIGPNTFPLERLTAIYFSLLLENAGDATYVQQADSTDLYAELSSLVRLNLLSSASSGSWDLDQAKFRCNIGFPFAEAVAKSISVDLSPYLYDDPNSWS